MIEVKLTKDIIDRAKKKAAAVGVLQGSITGGLSNVVGAIGEVIVGDAMGANEVNTFNYDLVKDGNRIDVKTKRCNTKPFPNYDCSVASHGLQQDCDTYVFVRIKIDMTRAWILGEISKGKFLQQSVRYSKGDVDPSNGFVFKADCYNIPISKLEDIDVKKTSQMYTV
jgi:hypothetical protein